MAFLRRWDRTEQDLLVFLFSLPFASCFVFFFSMLIDAATWASSANLFLNLMVARGELRWTKHFFGASSPGGLFTGFSAMCANNSSMSACGSSGGADCAGGLCGRRAAAAAWGRLSSIIFGLAPCPDPGQAGQRPAMGRRKAGQAEATSSLAPQMTTGSSGGVSASTCVATVGPRPAAAALPHWGPQPAEVTPEELVGVAPPGSRPAPAAPEESLLQQVVAPTVLTTAAASGDGSGGASGGK